MAVFQRWHLPEHLPCLQLFTDWFELFFIRKIPIFILIIAHSTLYSNATEGGIHKKKSIYYKLCLNWNTANQHLHFLCCAEIMR